MVHSKFIVDHSGWSTKESHLITVDDGFLLVVNRGKKHGNILGEWFRRVFHVQEFKHRNGMRIFQWELHCFFSGASKPRFLCSGCFNMNWVDRVDLGLILLILESSAKICNIYICIYYIYTYIYTYKLDWTWTFWVGDLLWMALAPEPFQSKYWLQTQK